MDHVEPVTCSVCGRKFPPKFVACIYCKAPRPGAEGEGADSAAKLARASVRPVPAARIAAPSSAPPPAPAAAAAAGAAGAVAAAPRIIVPLVTVDDAPGAPLSVWLGRAFALVAAVGAVYAVTTLYSRYAKNRIDLWVVNTTGTSGMSLVLDGKVVIENIPSTPVESPSSARRVVITSGAHTLEARESNGNLVDTTSIDVPEDSHGFLFAPKRSSETCFGIERTEYGSGSDQRIVPLDPKKPIWEMTSDMDGWFTANPATFSVPAGGGTVVRRSARLMPCVAFENGMIRRGSAAGAASADGKAAAITDAGADAP